LFEDSAALLGLIVAFVGIFLGQMLNNPYIDAAATVVIGLILMVVATVLAYESRKLLLGESADREVVESIQQLVASDPAVKHARKPLTMHFGPHEVLVNLELTFKKSLSAGEITTALHRLDSAIREKHANVKRVFLEMGASRDGADTS
jgi:divalent metal cation (Fe/Co/Zn/Cd) transporter